jgi:sodium/proline symporter
MFATGYGVEGGFSGMIAELRNQDENLVGWVNPESLVYRSWWSVLAIFISHVPLGLLPHIGNKLWALKSPRDQRRFILLAFTFGLTLGMLGLGGILSRAILGDDLLEQGLTSNSALPALFIKVFPAWLAALLGVGILSAVMSTADGLVVSSSQIIANDLYRCTFVPRYRAGLDPAAIDRRVLNISRGSTIVVMLICTLMAWALVHMNVALIVWIGSGGMMTAFAGPLVLGALWSGVTRNGAFAGLISGVLVFSTIHSGVIDPEWFAAGPLRDAALWLQAESPNPFSCAAMGEVVSVFFTWAVSLASRPLPEAHLKILFPEKAKAG